MNIELDTPLATNLNLNAVMGMAIATAFHQLGWYPDTSFEECWSDDFRRDIQRLAYQNLGWALGNNSLVITNANIAQALWGMDEDQFVEALVELEE
jgi:hypothetical protein